MRAGGPQAKAPRRYILLGDTAIAGMGPALPRSSLWHRRAKHNQLASPLWWVATAHKGVAHGKSFPPSAIGLALWVAQDECKVLQTEPDGGLRCSNMCVWSSMRRQYVPCLCYTFRLTGSHQLAHETYTVVSLNHTGLLTYGIDAQSTISWQARSGG